jgi:hypothetical protein
VLLEFYLKDGRAILLVTAFVETPAPSNISWCWKLPRSQNLLKLKRVHKFRRASGAVTLARLVKAGNTSASYNPSRQRRLNQARGIHLQSSLTRRA